MTAAHGSYGRLGRSAEDAIVISSDDDDDEDGRQACEPGTMAETALSPVEATAARRGRGEADRGESWDSSPGSRVALELELAALADASDDRLQQLFAACPDLATLGHASSETVVQKLETLKLMATREADAETAKGMRSFDGQASGVGSRGAPSIKSTTVMRQVGSVCDVR